MKLDPNAVIAREKLTEYLLVSLPKDDKSRYLALAGYTLENWQQLERDLREQILSLEAVSTIKTRYGQKYAIVGNLTGGNGITIQVKTILDCFRRHHEICYPLSCIGGDNEIQSLHPSCPT